MDRRLLCVWDANLNRAREGIRVVEDLARFVYREATWTSELKTLRHALTRTAGAAVPEQEAVLARAAGQDVGAKPTPPSESARADTLDLLQANFNRAAEAVRVLEETAKLLSGLGAAAATSKKFKALRFRLYVAEEKMQNTENTESDTI